MEKAVESGQDDHEDEGHQAGDEELGAPELRVVPDPDVGRQRERSGSPAPRRARPGQRDPLRIALKDGRGVAGGRRPAHGVRAVDEELDRGAPPGQEVLREAVAG
ncbi:MAG: hypothetical protein MZV64_22925 [Ignavibacteriales bacterium]|nr:hypothetical protein [Ignavibacteriales bacterium]